MADQTDQTPDRPDRTGPVTVQTGPSDRWHDNLALIPWSAGLLAAGYYQSDLAHQTFGWAYPWALAFPLAIEAGVAWSAGNFHRRLVRRDSAIGARVWLLMLMAFSCGLLFFHADRSGAPIEGAAAISAMTLISAGVWLQRASSRRRDSMRERGLVYPATPNFPAYRWVLCPIETWKAFRYGIKHGLEDPLAALDALRQTGPDRTKQTTRPDRSKASKQTPVQTPGPDRTPDQTADRPVADQTPTVQTGPHDQTDTGPAESDRSRPVLHSADQTAYIDALTQHPKWPQTSLEEIRTLVAGLDPDGKCGKSRAIRLRDIALKKEAA